MARSSHYSDLEQTSKSITDALVPCATVHTGELSKTAARIRACASVIPLTAEVTHAVSTLELMFELEAGDTFVYASIHEYLREHGGPRSLFVTRDKDFVVVTDDLVALGSELVLGFAPALTKIREAIAKPN